jgi:ABC-2 type transport system ATP-binding protein
LRVHEQISLIGGLYPGWSEARATALCRRFNLPDDMRVRSLSPGEKQRLAIVLALAHQPELLVFDEPVSSLDPVGRRDFLRALFEQESLTGDAVTVVISSHLLDDLERVATHLLFLDNGRIQLIGARDELAEQIRTVFTEATLPTNVGLIHANRMDDGTWQSVIDLRIYPSKLLPANARVQALGLADLFVALNA